MISRIQSLLFNRRAVLRDVGAVAGSRLIRQAVLMIAMAIAARVLGQEQMGIWALIYIVIQFGVLLSDSGISTFVVQNRDLADRKYSTAFYLSTLLAIVVATTIAAIGVPLAIGLGLGSHRWHFVAAAITIIPMAMNGLLQAKLRRNRRFVVMFIADLSSSATLLVGVVGMLRSGFELWSFIIPTAVAALAGFAVCVLAMGVPRLTVNRTDAKEIADYSLGLVGFSSVNYWARNVDHVLIGRFLGAAPLGVYSFAYRIMMLPLSQINATAHTVALPYLSPHQDDPEKLRDAMRKIITVIGMLATLPMIWIWLERDFVVRLVLGDQWSQVGELLAVLAPLAVLQSLVNPTGLCFQVRGRTKLLFGVGMINTAVTVIGFVIGVGTGSLMGVVVCYAIANLIMVPITVGSAMKTIDASFKDWLSWSAPFFVLVLLSGALANVIPTVSSPWLHGGLTCLVTGMVGVFIYGWVGWHVFSVDDDGIRSSLKSPPTLELLPKKDTSK